MVIVLVLPYNCFIRMALSGSLGLWHQFFYIFMTKKKKKKKKKKKMHIREFH